MNSYYFEDEINLETVNNLVDKLQTFEGDVNLWFSTCGGHSNAMMYLIEYLNSRKDEITVTVTNELFSAGTFLLTYFKGKIKVYDLDSIIFHVADRAQYMLRKNFSICSDRILKQDIKYNKDFIKKVRRKKLLTEKQIKKYLKGEDVVLYKKDIKKLCKNNIFKN